MFSFIKNKLTRIYVSVTQKFTELFSSATVDEQLMTDLEKLLLQADVGVATTQQILTQLRQKVAQGKLTTGEGVRQQLEELLVAQLLPAQANLASAQVIMLVGVNGSGKTTFAAKLAAWYQKQGKRVLLVAADTFRAAAVAQLQVWGERLGCSVVAGEPSADPASVVYQGVSQFKEDGYDLLLIDTAGRLQTKSHLMQELGKLKRVIAKQLPQHQLTVLLTIDAMLGANSVAQARIFHEATTVHGLVLTKMDGTGKGGVVFSISHELAIPVVFISFGEQIADMAPFSAQRYVSELLGG